MWCALNRRPMVRVMLVMVVALPLVFQTACGTLLHPERRGQTEGRIDPSIAILNGIGLLFFVIPGLIAFAVDFSTGAIYLPPDEEAAANGDEDVVVHVDPDSLTPEKLSQVIYEHTGERVEISEAEMRLLARDGGADVADQLQEWREVEE